MLFLIKDREREREKISPWFTRLEQQLYAYDSISISYIQKESLKFLSKILSTKFRMKVNFYNIFFSRKFMKKKRRIFYGKQKKNKVIKELFDECALVNACEECMIYWNNSIEHKVYEECLIHLFTLW